METKVKKKIFTVQYRGTYTYTLDSYGLYKARDI